MENDLSKLIKNKREEKGFSQRELAKKINVDNATISKIENGITKKPSLETLIKLSRILDNEIINFQRESENYNLRIEKLKNTINKLKEEQSKIKTYSQDYDKGRLMGLIWALRILTNEEVE